MGSSPIATQASVHFVADPVDGAYLAQMGAEEVPQPTAAEYEQQPAVAQYQQQPTVAYEQQIAAAPYGQPEPEQYKTPVTQYEQPEPEQPAVAQYTQLRYTSGAEPSREQECISEGDQVSELRAKLA